MAAVDVGDVVCDWPRELFGDGLASPGSLQPQEGSDRILSWRVQPHILSTSACSPGIQHYDSA